jgi:hypothetical protein
MILIVNENLVERFRRKKRKQRKKTLSLPPFWSTHGSRFYYPVVVGHGNSSKRNWPINISINNVQRLTPLRTTIERQRQGRSGVLVDRKTELRKRERRAD